jgi:hypothetical protein
MAKPTAVGTMEMYFRGFAAACELQGILIHPELADEQAVKVANALIAELHRLGSCTRRPLAPLQGDRASWSRF